MANKRCDLVAGSLRREGEEMGEILERTKWISGSERTRDPNGPSDPDFVVLADTEGNRFCVVDASHG